MDYIEIGKQIRKYRILRRLSQALQVSSDDILNINVENSRNSTLSEITKAAKKSLQGFSIKQNSSSYDQ